MSDAVTARCARSVACCLRSDDVALLAEIAADRGLRALGTRLLAPTVVACDKPVEEALTALRAAGYAPVAETADGVPVLHREQPRRAATTPAPQRTAVRAGNATIPKTRAAAKKQTPDPAVVAAALLAAPDDAAPEESTALRLIRGFVRGTTSSEARILAYAVEHGLPVSIDYVNREGNGTSRVIENIELAGGSSLLAWCRLVSPAPGRTLVQPGPHRRSPARRGALRHPARSLRAPERRKHLLGLSRAFVIRLMDTGKLAFQHLPDSTHRLIRLDGVVLFRDLREQKVEAHRRINDAAKEMGLPY